MMSNPLNTIACSLLAPLVAVFIMTGCRSVTTLQLYNGPDVPPGQLTTLVVPWCISLRTIDGAEAPTTLANELRLILGSGPHSMEARYVVLYPTQGNDTEKITSDYIRLKFTGEPGKTYTICSKDPKTLDEARKYAAHVSLWIEENAGGAAKGTALKPSVPQTPATTDTKGQAQSSVAAGPKVQNPDVKAQLQQLWEKASEQDRKAFLDKTRQQP